MTRWYPWLVLAPTALVVGGDLLTEPAWRVQAFFVFAFVWALLVFPCWWIAKDAGK